jgi:hypothetical protein
VTAARPPAAGPRAVAAAAWRFRWQVELDAEARFRLLAERLESLGAPPALAELARRCAADEGRHAVLCARLAREYGAGPPEPSTGPVREYAPGTLLPRGKLLYELVASCCIAETESMGVLTTLVAAARPGPLRDVLRELASDEVRHGQLGWAYLAAEHRAGVTSFLTPLVPRMLQGNAPADLFQAAPPELEDEALLDLGVLPHSIKRAVFGETLEQVVFPGLERFGVDPGPAREWLEARRAAGTRHVG